MLRIKKFNREIKLPIKARNGDAGFDIFSPIAYKLYAQERKIISLGFAIELPKGYMALIQTKSSLAVNYGITTIGNVIDEGYRGECHAILYNTSHSTVEIERWQKIAQMILIPCYTGNEIIEVDELNDSERGTCGFGSTGK